MNLSVKSIFISLTLFVSLNINLTYGLRILGIFPYPIKSHQTMSEELMKGLAAKGHQVDVYSHFPLKKKIPNYTDFSLEGTVPIFSNNVTYDLIESEWKESSNMMRNWYGEYGSYICDLLRLPIFQDLIHSPPQDPPYDLFVLELDTSYCYMSFGRLLKVPVVGVVTSPLSDWTYNALRSPVNPAIDVSIDLSYNTPMTFFERLHNFFYIHSIIHSFNTFINAQDKQVEKYFSKGYPSVVDMQKDLSLVLVNHDMTLHGLRPFAPVIVPVGGLHIVDKNETLSKVVQKWLDDSKDDCIYFSFGSMTRIETFPKHILDAFYKSFEAIKPVRVLMKIAKPEVLPPGLPSNVLTQSWLQQTEVFKHKNIKAFVTHGGLMGTLEAIYYGVPLVGIPLYYDQPSNVASYVKKNIAVSINLDEITEDTFTNALTEILKNTVYRESVKDVSLKLKDRLMPPLDTAIYWIEYIHRHGKDALRSQIIDLPWWQVSLLDVYAFILILISFILYVIVRVSRKLSITFRLQSYKDLKIKKF